MRYQSEQPANKFKEGIRYIVSFIGEEGKTARFVGVYKIMSRKPSLKAENEVLLDLKPIDAFSHLEKRVMIDWVSPANSWHQYLDIEKPVIRIDESLPNTDLVPAFKSYLDIILNYDQLKQIVNIPEWVEVLNKINCIYAILDASNGKLYVGSTYDKLRGMHERWEKYAQTGHGGNKDLEQLINKDPDYGKNNFKWCILEVLPLDINGHDAIEREGIWKEKLGARIYGYCNN